MSVDEGTGTVLAALNSTTTASAPTGEATSMSRRGSAVLEALDSTEKPAANDSSLVALSRRGSAVLDALDSTLVNRTATPAVVSQTSVIATETLQQSSSSSTEPQKRVLTADDVGI